MHGHPFDSKHTFHINRFSDIERYANMDETYIEPKMEEYRPKVCTVYRNLCFRLTSLQEHLRAWLADPYGRDQYVTYRGDDVEIRWHGKPSQCEVAYAKKVCGCSMRDCILLKYSIELDRTLRVMVTSRHILRYAFPSRCPPVGWTVMGTSTSFCAPSCQVD